MSDGKERRTSERKKVEGDVEFILYLDAYQATSVNLSETGIRFDTEKPIYIRLQAEIDGKKLTRDAQLVWASKKDDSGMSYGFEFVPDLD